VNSRRVGDAYTIELDEPLGDRTLLDGGQLPPGDPLEDPQN
jgi:hypothetical protein